MFSGDTARYPFSARAAYTPDVSHIPDDPLTIYASRMERDGIDRAVLVHPEPYGDDHTLLLDCLAREPERLRGACLFFPKDPTAPQKLAALVEREPRIVAVRFHAHRGKEQYLDSFADEGVRALWAQAATLGLIVELHIGPNYATQVAERIHDFPNTPVLIDHLAEPGMGNAVEYAHVLELARFPNVFMKLSELEHVSSDAPLYADLAPFTRRVAAEFGPERVVWGGGTPHIVDAHLTDWSVAERALVKGGNLARMLGFAF